MYPESSLPCSQKPANSPCHVPDEPYPYFPILFSKDPFKYYPPHILMTYEWAPRLGLPNKILCTCLITLTRFILRCPQAAVFP